MWVIVTRYVTPKGQVIRHVYLNLKGEPWKSYAAAHARAKKMLETAQETLPGADLECHAVKMLSRNG
jgi:hypothetical protein